MVEGSFDLDKNIFRVDFKASGDSDGARSSQSAGLPLLRRIDHSSMSLSGLSYWEISGFWGLV